MKPNTMIIALSISVFIILLRVMGGLHLFYQFHKQVKSLFSQSEKISGKAFNYSQLTGLPDPVQRYFKYVLKSRQPYISYARITHNGQFKTGFDKDWINIKGEQYATTQKPGFIWKGTTSVFVARDMYISNTGRLVVSLFSLYSVVNAHGDQYNQGELLRWLGESILYPTNLLPCERLRWLPVDDETAKLIFNYNGLSLSFIMKFNASGEILSMETKRYMDTNHLETWVIKPDRYEERNGIIVPLQFEVLWRLVKGDFSYAKFTIQKIEYNVPELF